MLNFDLDCDRARLEGAKAASLDDCPYSSERDPLLWAIWQDAFVTEKLYQSAKR